MSFLHNMEEKIKLGFFSRGGNMPPLSPFWPVLARFEVLGHPGVGYGRHYCL